MNVRINKIFMVNNFGFIALNLVQKKKLRIFTNFDLKI